MIQNGLLQSDSPSSPSVWLTITEAMYDTYCQSHDNVLMFVNQNNDKLAMTKDLLLRSGDIVQFKVSTSKHLPLTLLAVLLIGSDINRQKLKANFK